MVTVKEIPEKTQRKEIRKMTAFLIFTGVTLTAEVIYIMATRL